MKSILFIFLFTVNQGEESMIAETTIHLTYV